MFPQFLGMPKIVAFWEATKSQSKLLSDEKYQL